MMKQIDGGYELEAEVTHVVGMHALHEIFFDTATSCDQAVHLVSI